MKLEGRVLIENILINSAVIEHSNPDAGFSKELDECLILLLRALNVPTPLWLNKNTHEFAAFRQTVFFADQFTDEVNFDRFQIKLIES